MIKFLLPKELFTRGISMEEVEIKNNAVTGVTYNSNKTEVTVKEHIENFFIKEIKVLVSEKPNHFIIAADKICSGIELLGKIIDNIKELDVSGRSELNFTSALKRFETLNKYSAPTYIKKIKKNNKTKSVTKSALYKDVRCSFSHGLMNGKYINITSSINGGIIKSGDKWKLGAVEFFKDFEQACNELLQSKEDYIVKKLNTVLYDVF